MVSNRWYLGFLKGQLGGAGNQEGPQLGLSFGVGEKTGQSTSGRKDEEKGEVERIQESPSGLATPRKEGEFTQVLVSRVLPVLCYTPAAP